MQIVDTFGHRLQQAMNIRNLKQVDLVNKTGLDKTLINKYLAGIMKAKQDKLTILANALDVNEVWLMGYNITMEREIIEDSNDFPVVDKPKKIPIFRKISAKFPIFAEENIEGYEYTSSCYLKENFEYFYLRVQSDCMNLKFRDGDIVLVQRQSTLENNEIGVIIANSSDAIIKQYRFENGLIILSPMSTTPIHNVEIYNPANTDIKILGKVIGYQGKV